MPIKINKNKDHDYPKNMSEWAAWVNELHDQAINERRPYEFQWAVNHAYRLGYQHLTYTPLTGSITRDIDNEELIVNRIAPFVETRVSKLTASKPTLEVTPDQMEPRVVQGAKLSTELGRYLWKTQEMDSKAREGADHITVMGNYFIKVLWNPETGEKIIEPLNAKGELEFEASGEQVTEDIFMGEIETHVKSPYAVLAAPGATTDIQKAAWLIDRSHMTVRQIKETWPDAKLDGINFHAEMTIYEKFVNDLSTPMYNGYIGDGMNREREQSRVKDEQVALVKEFWMKPNAIYPKGLVITIIDNKVIEFDKFPNDILEYPFIKMSEKINPFKFYSPSSVTRLLPLQRRYNAARTQISKNAALMANVKWSIPKGSGISEESLTDEEGEVIEHNPNVSGPKQIGVAPLPNYVIESQLQDLKDIRDVGGEREASELPFPNLTAGVALETAAELSNVLVTPILRNIEEGYAKLGRLWLMLANKHYTDPRTLKIVGENDEVNIQKFKNTDLKHQTDITVRADSQLGQSKAARQQKIIDLWDRRVIQDPKVLIKSFATGDLDMLLKAEEPAEMVVIEDIEKIKNGEQPQVLPFDNHIMYVRMLSNFIQSPEFRRIPQDRQQLALQTLQQHIQHIQPAQEQQPNPAAVNTPFGSQRPEGAQ